MTFIKTMAVVPLALSLLVANNAFADDGKQNLIGFEVSSQSTVQNDEASAVMSKTMSAKNAKELATKLNPLINQSLAIAKKYPSVKVSTGSQYAHPEYSKGKIIGVSGSASLNLKSQDTEALSNLMAELQNSLLLESLSFDVSDALRESTNNRLRDEATQKFKNEANSLVKAWGAKSYRLINAQMNSHSNGSYAKRMFSSMAVAEQAMDAAASQNLEAGSSEIRYTINGTIQLVF